MLFCKFFAAVLSLSPPLCSLFLLLLLFFFFFFFSSLSRLLPGYGTFAPQTWWGQLFLVLFALIGIPSSGLTLVHLANAALSCATRLFTMGSDKVQKAFDAFDTDGSGELDLDEFREAITSLGMALSDNQFSEVRCCCLLLSCLRSCLLTHTPFTSFSLCSLLFFYFFFYIFQQKFCCS